MTKQKVVSGATVELTHVDDWGLNAEDGGKWVLVCLEHSSILQDTNKSRLWTHADDVASWCEVHNESEKVGA